MKNIKNFPDYYITSAGKIYSTSPRVNRVRPKKPVELKPYKAFGYWKISLFKNGKSHKRYIHSLVLETYVGSRPKGFQCRHLNGIKTDNRVKNLAWGTRSENQLDRNLHGTGNQGEQHGASKYTNKFVLRVRELCKKHQQKDVAKMLGIPKSTVSALVTQGWKHLNNAK